MAAALPEKQPAFAPARRIAGRIPPTLQLVKVVVANVEARHAAVLVKALSKELPLGPLQHLKRVRRIGGCEGSAPMMQLILHSPDYVRSGMNATADAGAGGSGRGATNGRSGGTPSGTAPPAATRPAAAAPVAAAPPAAAGGKAGPAHTASGSAGSTCTCFAAHHTHRHPTTHVVTACTGRCAACGNGATASSADPTQQQAANGHPHPQQQQQQQQRPPPADLPLLCPAAAAILPLLPPRVATTLAAAAAVLDVAEVPGVAPDNREQWSEWNQLWPMPWKLPSGQPHQDGQAATAEDQSYFSRHLARALAASAAAGGANVCVIVDPATGEIIAEAADCSAAHPLRHAAMEAVAAAAERDLRLWPVNGFVHLGRQEDTSALGVNTIVGCDELVGSNAGSASGDEDGAAPRRAAGGEGQQQQQQQQQPLQLPPQEPSQQQQQQQQHGHEEHALSGLKHCHSHEADIGVDSPAKRQRVTNGFGHHAACSSATKMDAAASNGAGAAATANGNGLAHEANPQQQQQQQGEEDNGSAAGQRQQQQRQPSATPSLGDSDGRNAAPGAPRPPTPVPITNWANKPYLCNTYDAFLVREPCAMCGMALVHSRLARVVYCEADPHHGALGGAYRLQANRSLNHHYDVYHMPLARPGGGGGKGAWAAAGAAAAAAAVAVASVAVQ
jgi:tRNA(Arg) A34 adenosine deaminase TadA